MIRCRPTGCRLPIGKTSEIRSWHRSLPTMGTVSGSYELVRFVRPGDTVLHWYTRGGQRALVGYSTVAAEPGTTTMIWQSRGTSGQAHPSPYVEEPAWTAPLRNLTYFPAPITRDSLQSRRTEVLDLQARLKEAYGGGSLITVVEN